MQISQDRCYVVPVTSLAAAFWISCSFRVTFKGKTATHVEVETEIIKFAFSKAQPKPQKHTHLNFEMQFSNKPKF